MALPRGTIGLSAVCDCGISWSYSLTISKETKFNIPMKLVTFSCRFCTHALEDDIKGLELKDTSILNNSALLLAVTHSSI